VYLFIFIYYQTRTHSSAYK